MFANAGQKAELTALEQLLDQLQDKQANMHDCGTRHIDELLAVLEDARDGLAAASTERAETIQHQVTSAQREVFNEINKLSKQVDKMVVEDIEKSFESSAILDEDKVNFAIAQHLFREGMFPLADKFVREASVCTDQDSSNAYAEMYHILNELRSRHLEPAKKWANDHHNELELLDSKLEFRLHGVEFARMVQEGHVLEAVIYARQHFGRFTKTCLREVQTHMVFLLYASSKNIAHAKYAELASESVWTEVTDMFSRDCCRVLGLARDSPLHVVVNAGSLAIPDPVQGVAHSSSHSWRRRHAPRVDF